MRRVHLSEHDGDPGRATRACSGPRSSADIYAASTAPGAAGNAALHASSAVTATGATADAFVYATAAASAATGLAKDRAICAANAAAAAVAANADHHLYPCHAKAGAAEAAAPAPAGPIIRAARPPAAGDPKGPDASHPCDACSGKAHPGAARQPAIAGHQYALGQPDLQQWRAN